MTTDRAVPESPPSSIVRHAIAADLARLPAIEQSAAEAFRDADVSLSAEIEASPGEAWRGAMRGGTLWVAENEARRIVGFLAARRINRVLHIDEMDVAFDHQRRGYGRALLEAAIAWARKHALQEITLTTFRGLAFNRRFYEAAGFAEIAPSEMSPRMTRIMKREADYGLDPKERCAMVLRLRTRRRAT
jgi:GNAT superfamily N-acetyltransferase